MRMRMPHLISSHEHLWDEKQTELVPFMSEEFGQNAKLSPLQKKTLPNGVPFAGMRETQKDELETEDMGFTWKANQLERYRFERPARFRVLSDVLIRERRGLESETTEKLNKDDVIYVKKVRKQCAQFFWNTEGGWLTLFSNNGDRQLEQIKL